MALYAYAALVAAGVVIWTAGILLAVIISDEHPVWAGILIALLLFVAIFVHLLSQLKAEETVRNPFKCP